MFHTNKSTKSAMNGDVVKTQCMYKSESATKCRPSLSVDRLREKCILALSVDHAYEST